MTAVLSSALPLGLALVLALSLRAFFAGSETALVSLNGVKVRRLADEGHRRAGIVRHLIGDADRMLAMTLVGTNLMSVIIAQIGLALILVLLAGSDAAPLVATAMTTILVLVFGEILPKTVFRLRSTELALRYAYPLRFFELALAVVVRMVVALTGALVALLGRRLEAPSPDFVRAELRLLAELGEKSGGIPSHQRRMIHGVLDLRDRRVERAMVPLVDFVAVERGTDLERVLEVAAASGLSRIPVYENRIYNVIGLIHILDVIHAGVRAGSPEPFIRRDIRYVPESKNINVLLKEIQRSPHTMVFAVDEHGGVVGLVTVEDLVEEIVGELSDEPGDAQAVRRIGPRLLECDGGVEIDTLVEEYAVPLPEGDYETIAGFVLERVGAVPRPGERVETEELEITVSESDARAIHKLRIRSKTADFGATRQG